MSFWKSCCIFIQTIYTVCPQKTEPTTFNHSVIKLQQNALIFDIAIYETVMSLTMIMSSTLLA